MLRFDKAIYLYFLLKSVLSVRLSDILRWSGALLFLEFINTVSVFALYVYWIHYVVIYLLVMTFAQYKEYMIYLILFSTFSDGLPAFTCARAIGYFESFNFCRFY